MAKHKSFGQEGVGSDLQYGKRGGRLRYDSVSEDFFFRDQNDTFYTQVHGGTPTEATHFTTKSYVDAAVSPSQVPEFYGVIVEESDGTNTQDPNDVIRFNAGDFVVSTDGDGKPLVSLESDVGGGGFYGIIVGETNSGPVFDGIEGIKFNTDTFYVTQNDPNTDEAIVNLRGSFRDPLFRTGDIALSATTNIGSPLPIGAVVKKIKLLLNEVYSASNVEVVVRSASLSADQIYMPADENDPTDANNNFFVSETGPTQKAIDGTRQVVATISNSPTSGSATITVEYLLP